MARYIYRPNHPRASKNGFVSADDVGWDDTPTLARNALISTDRHYENTCATDGTDIGSRRKHREYQRIHGLAMADDFGGEWKKAQGERERIVRGDFDHNSRREAIARALTQRK